MKNSLIGFGAFSRKKRLALVVAAALSAAGSGAASAQTTTLYDTLFLPPQFQVGFQWAGQNGWIGIDTDGLNNGVDFLGAYLGGDLLEFRSPIVVYRDFNFNPVSSGFPIVTVTTTLSIDDSTNSEFDTFELQIWNSSTQLLAALSFDNSNLRISRRDGSTTTFTGSFFVNDLFRTVVMTIDFGNNTWSATYGGQPIFTNATFSNPSLGRALNFGSFDVAWRLTDTSFPGDNLIQLSALKIEATARPVPPAPPSPPSAPNISSARPVVRVARQRTAGNQRSVRVVGTASSRAGIRAVTYQVGRLRARRARGAARWNFRAPLERGINVITVVAIDSNGTRSKPLRLRVLRFR